MEHNEAQETGAVERYLLGELDPAAREAFEEHFFGCGECADDVREGTMFLDNAKGLLVAAGAPQTFARARPAQRRVWRAWFWPVPAGALAASVALLMCVVYQGVVVYPRLSQEAARSQSIQAVPWTFLAVSRAAPQIITVSKAQHQVGLTLSRSAASSFAYYRCTLSRADGRAVVSSVVVAPPAGEELQLLLPLAQLVPADYVLIVAGMASETTDATDPQATQYHFTLRYQEGAL